MAENRGVRVLDAAATAGTEGSVSIRKGTPAAASEYRHGIGYLRAFVIVLVLAHHALFAYNPAPPPPAGSLLDEPRWWRAFPIVDGDRFWEAMLLNAFTDTFFMSLMFFVSGLFVLTSLRRKGGAGFLRDRARRLGVPFVVAVFAIAPLAYYPAYLARTGEPSVADYARQWLSLGEWPAGPAWFIWVLLAFNALTAAAARFAPGPAAAAAATAGAWLRQPVRLFAALVVSSAALYIPLSLLVGATHWTVSGPFAFQTSRLPHYALYFTAGLLVGAHGVDRGPLASGGRLAARWPIWVSAAGAAYILFVAIRGGVLSVERAELSRLLGALAFSVSCAASSLGLTAVFLRFADGPSRLFDSLRDNAYGIYLIHFPFSNGLQYLLLGAAIPPEWKAVVAFGGTLTLSWGVTALLRRLPAVARVI